MMKTLLQNKRNTVIAWGIIVVTISFILTGSLSGSIIGYVGGVLYDPTINKIISLVERFTNKK